MTSSKLSTPRPRTGRRKIERGSPLLWPAGRAGAAWLAVDDEGTLVIVDPGLGYWFGLSDPDELLALNMALERLEGIEPRLADVVKLRYFAGLTVDETAAALQESPRTIARHWAAARAWLSSALAGRMEEASEAGD